MLYILFYPSNYVPYWHVLASNIKEQSRKSEYIAQTSSFHCPVITQHGAVCEPVLKYRQLKKECKIGITRLKVYLWLAAMSACLLNGLQVLRNTVCYKFE